MLKMESVKLGIPLENCLQAINWSNELAEVLAEMKWSLIIAPPGHFFVTSDTPVHPMFDDPQKVIAEQGVDIATVQTFPALMQTMMRHSRTDVTFPISPQVAMVADWNHPEGYVDGSVEDVSLINHRTIIMAERWVYASANSDALDREVQLQTGSRERLREA